MAKRDTLFTVAGITTHRGVNANGTVSERTKVRYGTDLVRVVKMLSNPKKIEDKTLGICLAPTRIDIIELPRGMVKMDVLDFLAAHPDFQSPEDQAVIRDDLESRAPKVPRERKPRVAKQAKAPREPKARGRKVKQEVKVPARPSLENIRARGQKTVVQASPPPLGVDEVMSILDEVVAELNVSA
jgi:hypothetical protein